MLQLSQGGSCDEQMPEECSDVLRRESKAVRSKEGTLVSVQAGLCGGKRSEGHRSGYRCSQDIYTTTYTTIPLDPSPDLAARIKAYTKALFNSGFIEVTFLTPKNPVKTQSVYFLRKIHKTPHQIRPIVSGINGPTCNISAFLDYFFKPVLPTIPSYLKDTSQLIATLKTLHLNHGHQRHVPVHPPRRRHSNPAKI